MTIIDLLVLWCLAVWTWHKHYSEVFHLASEDVHKLVKRRRRWLCCVHHMCVAKVGRQGCGHVVVSKDYPALEHVLQWNVRAAGWVPEAFTYQTNKLRP